MTVALDVIHTIAYDQNQSPLKPTRKQKKKKRKKRRGKREKVIVTNENRIIRKASLQNIENEV